MGFKVQTNSEQIGVLLEKYSNNRDIFAQLATVYKRWKRNKNLISGKKECELT